MKKIIAILLLAVSGFAFAEASFDEIQSLINSKQYAAAEAGLEVIIKNHPQSAKAFYAMAEAQAGLGNLDKAQKALNIAKGFDPSLKFVSEGSVRSLEQAITPQTSKITYEEPSHFWRNFGYFLLALVLGYGAYYMWCAYHRKQEEEEEAIRKVEEAERNAAVARQRERERQEKEEREAQEAALRAHKNYGKPGFDPENPDKLKTKKQLKEEADALALREATARAEAAEAEARRARSYSAPQPTTTIVNNSSNDMLTGVLIGNMLSDHGHHDTTRVIEREVVREKPSRDSSWDSTPSTPSRSSSWDDDTPSKKSSSWDSDSSSSSSSWSSSSDSSSSWDSGSSSSSSSWD